MLIPNLFVRQQFIAHAGQTLDWKIDCDALTTADLNTIAWVIAQRFRFRSVRGIPRGGLRLANALQPYIDTDSPNDLIVDDVLTTGMSMARAKERTTDIGVVIFCRGHCPDWVWPLFQLGDAK